MQSLRGLGMGLFVKLELPVAGAYGGGLMFLPLAPKDVVIDRKTRTELAKPTQRGSSERPRSARTAAKRLAPQVV